MGGKITLTLYMQQSQSVHFADVWDFRVKEGTITFKFREGGAYHTGSATFIVARLAGWTLDDE